MPRALPPSSLRLACDAIFTFLSIGGALYAAVTKDYLGLLVALLWVLIYAMNALGSFRSLRHARRAG